MSMGGISECGAVLKRYYKIVQTEKGRRKQGEKPIKSSKSSLSQQENDAESWGAVKGIMVQR